MLKRWESEKGMGMVLLMVYVKKKVVRKLKSLLRKVKKVEEVVI